MDLVRLQPSTFTSETAPLDSAPVWAVASDPLLLPPLSSELQEVRILGDGPVTLGTRFHGDQLRGSRRWTTTSTVTAFEPCTFFEWTVGDLAQPVSRWSFLLDAHRHGTTLTQRVVLCGGPSPLTDFITEHPESADQAIHERLDHLRQRMAVTVAGLLAIAGSAGDPV
jgi:hypothetical protein